METTLTVLEGFTEVDEEVEEGVTDADDVVMAGDTAWVCRVTGNTSTE